VNLQKDFPTVDRHAGLRLMLEPASVAIVGASDDPTRIGGRPLRYMRDAGFDGAIYPINPNHKVVQGLRTFSSEQTLRP